MWNRYRKTFWPTQLTIGLTCLALVRLTAMPAGLVFMFFLTMELGAVAGAWWAARLADKLAGKLDTLPLRGR